jgi:hypothetical protein
MLSGSEDSHVTDVVWGLGDFLVSQASPDSGAHRMPNEDLGSHWGRIVLAAENALTRTLLRAPAKSPYCHPATDRWL